MGHWKNESSRVFCSDNGNEYCYFMTNCGEAVVLYQMRDGKVRVNDEIARYSYSALAEEADERGMYVHQVMAEYFDLSTQAHEINTWLKQKREEVHAKQPIVATYEYQPAPGGSR